METPGYDNYEQEASRKRTFTDDQGNVIESKRPNIRGDQPLLKLVVPNFIAGVLIGKGGTNIGELQTKFGGRIRLSANRQYYPGTAERVVVITGEVSQLIDYNSHIMEKLEEDTSDYADKKPKDDKRGKQVKIILTNGAAGLLIGRAGATIKAIQEETKVKITITNRENATVPGERMLTMSGSMEERIEGCQQVIEKIAEEVSNMANTSLKYSSNLAISASVLGGMQQNTPYGSPNSLSGSSFAMPGLSNQSGLSKLKTSVEITMEVPDILVGSILGKQGQTISEFIQFSGAKIQFSGKNEFAAGTTDRILTITGDLNETQTAYFLISQKVEQAENELSIHQTSYSYPTY